MARVVAFGMACLDCRFWVRAFPPTAPRTRATAYLEDLGGPAAVAGRTVARLGGEAVFVGSRGDDATGRRLERWLADDGVDVRAFRVVPGARTPVSAVLIAPGGERSIIHYPGEGLRDDAGAWWDESTVTRADAVVLDLRRPRAAAVLARQARAAGRRVVLDMDQDTTDAWDLAALSTHVVADQLMTGGAGGLEPLLARLARLGAWGAVTMGSAGVRFLGGGVPGFGVTVRDSTGAGDVFHGAFALALAEGRDERSAAVFAAAAAAQRCALAEVPTRAQVDQLLEEPRA
jgi:sulfofructose kinase